MSHETKSSVTVTIKGKSITKEDVIKAQKATARYFADKPTVQKFKNEPTIYCKVN